MWDSFKKGDFPWNDSYKGRLYQGIAWYPAVGARNYSTSTISNVGVFGYYWLDSPFSENLAYYLYFINTNVFSAYRDRNIGKPLRCVKDE